MNDIKIIDGSIILSYSFIYDENSIEQKGQLPKIENLLSYADRIFENNKIYHYDNLKQNYFADIILRIEGNRFNIYKLKIEYVKILFFPDSTAMLYMKIEPSNKDLSSLYKINRALTQFYTKEKNENVSVYFGNKKFDNIKITKKKFQKYIENFQKNYSDKKDQKFCDDILKAIKEDVKHYENIYKDKYLELAQYKHNNEMYIKITPISIHPFITTLLNEYCPVYTPYISDTTREYPLTDQDQDKFKGRVGPLKQEIEEISTQKCKRHYFYFEKQLELVRQKEKEGKYEFVHYDTFITSLILKFVAPNTRLKYYDNFNPVATSYLNSYMTFICEDIKNEYENNFISFEPLINSKVSRGKKIIRNDFFEIYQSQADMFTIGNSHAIVHILDKEAQKIKKNKETTHFYTYVLSTVQRNFILNIISSSIININNLENQTASIPNIYHNFKKILKTVDDYNMFLTNYNFKVISNSSSVDNSYNFFRHCNEVDKLAAQWSSISFKMKDWKSILSHILQKKPILLLIIMFLLLIVVNMVDSGIKFILNIINNTILDITPHIVNFFTSF